MALTEEQAKYEEEYNKAFYGESDEANQEDAESPQEEQPEIDNVEDTDNAEEQGHETPSDSDDDGADDSDDEHNNAESDEEQHEPERRKYRLKVDGKEIEMDFTDDEVARSIQQSFDYTRKTQAIAQDRKTIEKIKAMGIDIDELEIMARAKQGDREALAYLTKQANVDPLDLVDADISNVRLQTHTEAIVPSQQVQEILQAISQDRELTARLSEAEKHIPLPVLNMASKDANALNAVVQEVRSGDFELVQPYIQREMMTMSEYDRALIMNSADAYIGLYNRIKSGMTNQPQTQQDTKPAPRPQVKPNMAEVGIKKSGASSKSIEASKDDDPFSNDDVYQKMLNQLNRFK